MKTLITGIGGFVGAYLARELSDRGHIVKGICKGQTELEKTFIELQGAAELFVCDICEQQSVDEIFESVDVDCVFHLAGIAHVPFAEKNCDLAFSVNTLGTMHILNAMVKKSVKKIIYISSSEVYGRQGLDGKPFIEASPVMPSNIYGISKASAEMLCNAYSSKYKINSIIFRPFNHIGPCQSPLFVASDFANQIAQIEKGDKPPCIYVGNLDVMRDFSDVRDIVNGYIQVKIDPAKIRKHETYYLGGSHDKLTKTTGWIPDIPLKKSLNDILEYWRENIFYEEVTL